MKLINLYEKLLTVYPNSYRNDYAAEMSQILTDMVVNEPLATRRALIWTRAFTELPIGLFMANIKVLESAYGSEAPAYVTRNTQLSALLVAPFVLIVIFNELRPDNLPNSPSAIDVLQFFLIALPLLALAILAATVLRWAYSRRKAGKESIIKSLTDIRHNWPLAVVTGLAFAIIVFMVGHDSVQCIAGNPIKEAQNFTATILCISRD